MSSETIMLAMTMIGGILIFLGYSVLEHIVVSNREKGTKKPVSKVWIACIVVGVVLVICAYAIASSEDNGRTTGKCWICGESGSYKMDGSYYCHKHYRARMSGKIG